MIRDFKTENTSGRLLIQKKFFGIGFHYDRCRPCFHREIKYSIIIDLIFMRFWIDFFAKQ